VTVRVGVLGIGLIGPGLANWRDAAPKLADPTTWVHAATVVPPPNRLAATERRRAGTVVKAALVAADEACLAAGVDPAALATVFTSSTGEPANCHALCEALAAPERVVSPTRFTNSVHNAAGGYWHIATTSMSASTSLGAYDASFAAGLLEAAVQVQASGAPVMLVASDVPYPEPLHAKRPVMDVFSVAMVLVPPRAGLATVSVDHAPDEAATTCGHAGLEAVRLGIPAARCLPLLQAVAGQRQGRLVVEGCSGASLVCDVAPA
jgi:hypothetical protein